MLEETAVSSAKIMERMEATLGNLEQMSYDTINTTDQLVTLLGTARDYNMQMRDGTEAERAEASKQMGVMLDRLLNISFLLNNLSHQLENETAYQRETSYAICKIIWNDRYRAYCMSTAGSYAVDKLTCSDVRELK